MTMPVTSFTELISRYAAGERDFRESELDAEVGDLRGLDFSGADFSGSFIVADFRLCNLQGTQFQNANVKTCDFRGADLRNSDFRHSALDGTEFENAILDGCRFAGLEFILEYCKMVKCLTGSSRASDEKL